MSLTKTQEKALKALVEGEQPSKQTGKALVEKGLAAPLPPDKFGSSGLLLTAEGREAIE
jgi:hypothetical protein